MPDLAYTVLASSGQDGPLLVDLGAVEQIQIVLRAIRDPQQLASYINSRLVEAEQALPEGTRSELSISGWRDPILGRSWASWTASKIQEAYVQGQIVDPDTGQPVQAWPEYPGQIAWGDDASDTVTIRAVKGFPVLWLIVGAALLVLGIWLWTTLRRSSWVASSVTPVTGPGTGLPTPSQVVGWIARNWGWLALGTGAGLVYLWARPVLIRAKARELVAERELAAAQRGEEV